MKLAKKKNPSRVSRKNRAYKYSRMTYRPCFAPKEKNTTGAKLWIIYQNGCG
jgi:hypothetical protein